MSRHRPILSAALLLCALAAGCRHKPAPVPLPPPVVVVAVPLATPPEPAVPAVVAQVPIEQAPLPAIKVPAAKVKKPRRKVTPAPAAPVEVASAGPAPAPGAAIGALTAGGDTSPEKKQKAAGMLTELDKRLAAVSAAVAEAQRDGLVRVRYFEHQARTALDSGDADGAEVLVTKARLLLDDLLK